VEEARASNGEASRRLPCHRGRCLSFHLAIWVITAAVIILATPIIPWFPPAIISRAVAGRSTGATPEVYTGAAATTVFIVVVVCAAVAVAVSTVVVRLLSRRHGRPSLAVDEVHQIDENMTIIILFKLPTAWDMSRTLL
jgi:hypothetical protein